MRRRGRKGEVASREATRRAWCSGPAGATARANSPGERQAAGSSIAEPAAGDVRSARGRPDVRDSRRASTVVGGCSHPRDECGLAPLRAKPTVQRLPVLELHSCRHGGSSPSRLPPGVKPLALARVTTSSAFLHLAMLGCHFLFASRHQSASHWPATTASSLQPTVCWSPNTYYLSAKHPSRVCEDQTRRLHRHIICGAIPSWRPVQGRVSKAQRKLS